MSFKGGEMQGRVVAWNARIPGFGPWSKLIIVATNTYIH